MVRITLRPGAFVDPPVVFRQIAGRDRVSHPTSDDSGGETAGIQATLIATKGQYQGRIGFLVPVYRRFNGTQLGAGTEFRAGFEALL